MFSKPKILTIDSF